MGVGKIIAVSNQKGGVGKTTTAINLSAYVAQLGKKVLLVDMDPQGNASSGVGVDKRKIRHSIYPVLLGEVSPADAAVPTRFANLSVLPAEPELAGAEIEMVGMQGRENVLKDRLSTLGDTYDFIFIDCPPSLGLLTLNALTAANTVIIPIQCEYFALEGVGQLMNTLKLVNLKLNPALEVEGVVLTMLDGRTNLGLQVVAEVKKHFRDKVFSTIVPRNVRLGEAPSHGLPIHAYDAKCAGAAAYEALAQELIEWNTPEEDKPSKGKERRRKR